MMQLQFKEAYSKDDWLKVEVSESIRKKEIVWKRVCVYEIQVHIRIWIKWGLHLSLSYVVNGVKVPDPGLGPTCFPSFILSLCFSLSLSPGSFCYVRTPYSCTWKNLCWFLWSLVRFTCANKKGLLTCKLCLGQYQQRTKASPWLSQESGIWLLPLGGKKGRFQRGIILEIFSRAWSSRATSSSHLSLVTGSCPQKAAII